MTTVSDNADKWAIWYWPASGQGATKISADDWLSDLQWEIVATGASGRSAGGSYATITLGAFFRIRFVYENFTSRSLMRSLSTFETHLKRGGLCQATSNSVKAWAGFCSAPAGPGTTVLQTQGSPFPAGVMTDGFPDVDLTSGDEVVIQSAWPESSIEFNTISTHAGNKITLASGLLYYHRPPIMIRHAEFYPVMVLSPSRRDGPILTADHGYGFTLDLSLDESSRGWLATSGLGGTPLAQPNGSGGSRIDLDGLVNRNNLGAGFGKTQAGSGTGDGSGGRWPGLTKR